MVWAINSSSDEGGDGETCNGEGLRDAGEGLRDAGEGLREGLRDAVIYFSIGKACGEGLRDAVIYFSIDSFLTCKKLWVSPMQTGKIRMAYAHQNFQVILP